jgi:hypothetical protein
MSVATFEPAPASGFAPQSINFNSMPDPAQYLPAGTPAARYRELVLKVEDSHKLIPAFDQRHQASLDRLAMEARLRELTEHPSNGGYGLSDDAPQVISLRRELADKAAELKRLTELDATRSAVWQACGGLLSTVRAWIAGGRPGGTVMEAIKVSAPRLQKSETIMAATSRLQQQANELRAEIAKVENAALPLSYARARLREKFETISRRGEIGVEHFLHREAAELYFPETLTTLQVNSDTPAAATGHVPDAIGLLFYTCPELLTALDKKLVAAAAGTEGHALAPDEKRRQTAELSEALFAVELDLATLMFDAWREGLSVEIDPGIQPAALLAVRNVALPVMPSETSGGHAYSIFGPR